MADLEDYAVMVAEADWGALAYQSATVIGVAALFYLFHLRITPVQIDTGHDYVFGNDTLQQVGNGATSTFLRSSTTTHIPTATVTQTVTATADPDKVASSLAEQLLPVLDSRIASLKRELIATQARHTSSMMIGLLLLFLLTTAFWYLLRYRPVYKALREERDRNTGGRLRYNNIRTTVDRPPAPEDPHSTEELVHGDRPNDNGGPTAEKSIKTETIDLTPTAPRESDTDRALVDGEHRKDNGTPIDHTNAGSDTVDTAPAPGEPVIEELADPTHSEVQSTVASPLLQSPPVVEAIIPQTPQEQPAFTNQPQPEPKDFKIPSMVFTRYNTQGLDDRAQLFLLLNSYFSWLGDIALGRISRSGNQKACDDITQGHARFSSWIEAGENKEGVHRAKTVATRRKRLEQQLHEHFRTVHPPTNLATLQNHKTDYRPTMNMLRNSEQARTQYDELNEQLTALESIIPTSPIHFFDFAVQESINAIEAAKRRAVTSMSTA